MLQSVSVQWKGEDRKPDVEEHIRLWGNFTSKDIEQARMTG